MKLIMIALMFMAASANAGAFKMIDLAHPQTSAGVFNDLKGHSDGGAVVAIVLQNGTLIPRITEGWTPITAGGTLGEGLGGPSISLGTGFNLLPITKSIVKLGLDAVSNKKQFLNVKGLLAPALESAPDFVPFVGPSYSLVFGQGKPTTMWTLFMGGTLKF